MADLALEVRFDKAKALLRLAQKMHNAEELLGGEKMQEVLEHLADRARRFMVDGIDGGRSGWPANHPITQALKGHGKTMVDSGTMRDSITAWEDGGEWYAGIPSSATHDGKPVADVAAIQEEGAHVPVTDGVRKLFASQGFPLRADTKFLRVPSRPWFQPSVDEFVAYADGALEELMKPVLDQLED